MSDQFILDDGNQFILFDGLAPVNQTVFNTPNHNFYVRADLTLRRIDDGSIIVIKICNREIITNYDYWPIMARIDNLGSKMGDYIPEQTRSSIIINNAPFSFGSERRFSDLLEKYTVIDQPCVIYLAQKELGNENVIEADFVEQWRSVVTNVTCSDDNLRITLSRSLIPNSLVTKLVDRISFPSAPQQSLGKFLPVIFSDTDEKIEIQPVQVSNIYTSGSEERLDFAYATTFANQYVPSGTSTDAIEIYNENGSREYQLVTFASNPVNPIYDLSPQPTSFKNPWGAVKEYGYALRSGENVTGGEVLVGFNWYLASTSFTTLPPAGTYTYTLKVYSQFNGFPGVLMASDTLENGDPGIVYHTTIAGNSIFKFEFRLSQAVQINGGVFVTLSRSDTGDLFSLLQDGTAPGSLPSFEKYVVTDTTAGTTQNFVRNVLTNNRDHFQVFALGISEDVTGGSSSFYQNGLGHATFTLRMRDQDGLPDITRLKLLARSRGLRDDSSGTLTGTANLRLTTPLQQIRLLCLTWNGTTWTETLFNNTKFNNTHTEAFSSTGRWRIRTAGATQGRTTTAQLISEICRSGNCRLVPYKSGSSQSLGVWAWGTNLPNSFVIDDENAKLISFYIGGVETIINRAKIVYDRRIQTLVESLLAEGELSNYYGVVTNQNTFLDVPYQDITDSIARWGERELGDVTYQFITKEQTARAVAAMMLRTYNKPSFTFEVEVPYNTFENIDVMSVGACKMVNLPDFYGTTHNARPVLASTNTDPLNISLGLPLKRAKNYRVLLLGNDIIISPQEGLKRVLLLRAVENIEVI